MAWVALRTMLFLPPRVARMVAYENAERIYKLKAVAPPRR